MESLVNAGYAGVLNSTCLQGYQIDRPTNYIDLGCISAATRNISEVCLAMSFAVVQGTFKNSIEELSNSSFVSYALSQFAIVSPSNYLTQSINGTDTCKVVYAGESRPPKSPDTIRTFQSMNHHCHSRTDLKDVKDARTYIFGSSHYSALHTATPSDLSTIPLIDNFCMNPKSKRFSSITLLADPYSAPPNKIPFVKKCLEANPFVVALLKLSCKDDCARLGDDFKRNDGTLPTLDALFENKNLTFTTRIKSVLQQCFPYPDAKTNYTELLRQASSAKTTKAPIKTPSSNKAVSTEAITTTSKQSSSVGWYPYLAIPITAVASIATVIACYLRKVAVPEVTHNRFDA